MELRRDLLLPIIVLVAVSVLTAFGAIGLLNRMSPAIEHILAENVYSLEAVEEMLALVSGPNDLDADQRARFAAAFDRARANITERNEQAPMSVVERDWREAADGNIAARANVVAALRTLGAINRDAMARADEQAKQLGTAGAWSAVFLGGLSFLIGLLAIRRARRRILAPLEELAAVVHAYRTGDPMRRCAPVPAPEEIARIMAALDHLLDRHQLRSGRPEHAARDDRTLLLHLLDQREDAVFVVDPGGAVDAANRAGLDRLSSDDGPAVRERLRQAVTGDGDDGIDVEHIERAERWLCAVR